MRAKTARTTPGLMLTAILALGLACASGGGVAPAGGDSARTDSMTTSQLAALIEVGEAPTIVDVRSRREYERGHVPGAIHIPFHRLSKQLEQLLPAARDGTVVVYCAHGPRALLAKGTLRRNGFEQVVSMKGHYSEWKRQGFPEERP